MALTVTEAHAVNRVVDYLLGGDYGRVTTDDEARDELAFLADHANETLMAGSNGERVRKRWPTHPLVEKTGVLRRLASMVAEGER